MKNKKLLFGASLILMLILLVSLVSALTLSSSPSSVDLYYEGQSKIINVTNTDADGNFNISINTSSSSLTATDSNGKHATFVIQPNTKTNVPSAEFNISLSSVDSGFAKGTYPANLMLDAVNLTSISASNSPLSVPLNYINSFCKNGPVNDTDLILDVKIDNKGQGKDNEWLPLDTIEVEVEFDNEYHDLEDIVFELGLFKEGSSKNIIEDMFWISDDEEKFEFGDIDEGDKGKHVFEFRINPEEIDGDSYLLMVKIYPSGEEKDICIDYSNDLSEFGGSKYFASITIEKETDRNKMVIIDEESLPKPIEGLCGQQVTFTADIYNIGDRDFEDQIMVSLYNKELGLDLKKVVLGDLDKGERTEVSFSFNIPSDAEEKQYTLTMRTFYDYDEGDGKYEEDYDRRSDDTFVGYLKVSGNCVVVQPVSVSASLESGGKAGEEMVVKVTVTNTGSKAADYTLKVAKYSGWASLISVEPDNFTLNKGESKEVLVTFDVKKDVSGEQSFDIEILSGGQLVATKPVSVSIEGSGLFSLTGGLISEENWYLWGLGVFNIILIIVIIFVAVRVARKRE